ncbi:MAG: lysostaphin resistance A-like protein [Clostridia bacterium]
MNTYGKLTVRASNWLLLIVLLLQFTVSFGGVLIVQIYSAITGLELSQDRLLNILLILTQFFAVFLPVVIYLKLKGVPVKDTLRLKPLKPFHMLLIIVMGITGQFIAQILNLPILLLLSLLGEIPPSPIPMPHTLEGLVVSLAIIALAPAICEELMMRGLIMRAYEIRGTKAGVVISALFFGIIHGDIKNLVAPIFFGLIFGYFVVRTGSILAGVLAHFVNNALAVCLGYLQENYAQQLPFLQSDLFILSAFFAAFLIFIPVFILFRNITKAEYKPPIASTREDLKAAFLNTPVIITLIIYLILQVVGIMQIINMR